MSDVILRRRRDGLWQIARRSPLQAAVRAAALLAGAVGSVVVLSGALLAALTMFMPLAGLLLLFLVRARGRSLVHRPRRPRFRVVAAH